MKKRAISLILVIAIIATLIPYVSLPSNAATSLPSSIYLAQQGSTTCTLCASTMMLRARMYLSGNNLWSSITESAVRSTAWIEGTGLKWSWTYSISGNSMSVAHASTSGISISSLKSLLNQHPEGIVLYCGKKPHAVFLTDYEGNTFYCADPVSSYAGCRRTLASSSLGKYYGSQASVLSNVTAYWYISSYNCAATTPTNVSVRTDKSVYNLGDSVTITPSGTNVDHYNLRICYGTYGDDTTVYTDFSGLKGATTYTPTKKGTYIVRVSACANLGSFTDAECTFTVASIPTNVSVTTNHHYNYSVGETVTIIPSGENVQHYTVRICYGSYGNDTTVYTDLNGFTGNKTYTPTKAGTYIVRISAVGEDGYFVDAECNFYVGAGPTNVSVTTNKEKYSINETVVITPSGNNIDHYNLRICYGIYGDDTTVYTDFSGLTSSTTYKPTKEGTYIVRISAVNSEGYFTDAETSFTVEGCTHLYVDTITVPTCTAQGYTTHTCSVCGDSYKDTYTNALGHSYTYKVTTVPTTSAAGVLTGTCSRCNGKTTVALPKLDATNYNYSVIKAATCTATGTGRYTWKTTTYGNFYFDVTIAKTAHSYKSTVTAPTCTAQGYTTHTCSVCGDSYKDAYTNALGHSHTYKVTTAPTTSATGVLTGTCSRCNGKTTIALPKLDTTNYNYAVTKAATCTATGTGRYTWKTTTYGNFYFDVTIAKVAHSYKTTVTAPTCTAQGYTTHTCSVCGDSYKDTYTNALGHSWNSGVVTKAATCTADGVKTYTCTRCNATKTEAIPKTGHNYKSSVTAPTCTAQGYTVHVCSVCGDSYKDTYTNALGHSYGSWVTGKAATCTAAGTETRTCSRCQNKETRTVAALGHAESDWIIDRNATCTASGSKHTECTRCGITMQTERIAATGHKESEWIIDRNATCTSAGSKHTECSTCGATLQTDTIAALGHDYKSTVTEPTCTAQGFTTHTCTRCNDTYKDTYTDALGHAWDNGKVTTEPTESAPGEKTFTCTRCGATRIESIPPLSHTHHYTATVTPPTCTAKGYTTHTCTCGDSYVDNYVDALGHAWDNGKVTTEPTETTSGVKTFTCTRCGATREEKIPPLNHTHAYTDTVTAPTCTEKGYTTHTCSCGDSYVDTYVDALGHDFGEWEVTQEATEEQAGEETRICARCGASETRETAKLDCPSAKFMDVNRNAWYHKAIDFAITNSIFSGMDDTHFKPNGKTTRAMFVAVLWRLDGKEESGAANPFVDVKTGSYYEKAVIWAAANKIVAGTDPNHFNPNGNVTREQVAAFLYRYASAKGYDLSTTANLNTFPDANEVSNYAREDLAWAVGSGLISGSKDTATGSVYLNPKGNATRAQVAQILMMFTQNMAR